MVNVILVILTLISTIYLLNNSQYALPIKKMSGYAKIIGLFLFCTLLILIVNQYIISAPILNKKVGETMLHLTIFLTFLLQAICAHRIKKATKSIAA
jgi:hypothetical protein